MTERMIGMPVVTGGLHAWLKAEPRVRVHAE
jgi:hypothetical protein